MSIRHRQNEIQDDEHSIASSHVRSTSPVRSMRRFTSVYTDINPEPENTRFISFNLPRRVFWWIYSFSLILLLLLMLSFVAVTPIDVIVQTSGSESSGIKMFIVIIVCVVFLVLSVIIYFLRMFHKRSALNDIPSKSVYIPFEGDMPSTCLSLIDKKLYKCLCDIKIRAGPLYNNNIINHPGISPPDYVQNRNISETGEGTLLPPNACYEDVIRSLGDKFRIDGRILTQVDFPKHFSFREIIVFLSERYLNDPNTIKDQFPNIKQLVDLYEKFKFGQNLIKENELLEFMIEFDKLSQFFQNNLGNSIKLKSRGPSKLYKSDHDILERSLFGHEISSRSEFYHYDSDKNDSAIEEERENIQFYSHLPKNKYYTNICASDSMNSVINPTTERKSSFSSGSWTGRSLKPPSHKRGSVGSGVSSRSVVKTRLAIPSASSINGNFDEMKFSGDAESDYRRYSGYITDSENESCKDDDKLGIYEFRMNKDQSANEPPLKDITFAVSDINLQKLKSFTQR